MVGSGSWRFVSRPRGKMTTMVNGLGELERLREEASLLALSFDADVLDGNQAKRAVAAADALERYAVAMKTLAMRRVDVTGAWSLGGDRSAERWLARVSGVSIGEAANVVAAGEQVEHLPVTQQALRAGELSGRQVVIVADAATINPDTEPSLLATAQSGSYTKLRDEALRVRLAAQPAGAQAKIHASRSHRSWIDRDGVYRYEGSNTVAAGKTIDLAFNSYTDKIFKEARAEDRRESRDAYAADAFVRIAEAASGTGASSEVCTKSRLRGVLVVDASAYMRDELRDGEVCEIAGLGPIDLASAKAMLSDAIIDIALTDGVDVRTLAHGGRSPTMRQWLVLYARGAVCGTTGCGGRHNLQADHIPEFCKTKRTTVEELRLECGVCHDLKSNHGYTDGPLQADGTRPLIPPPNARAPDDP
jgi:hypothetical protein